MSKKFIAGCAIAAVLACGSPLAAHAAEFTMNLGVANPIIPDHFSWTHIEVLEREIEARSGGRIDVTIYPGAQLGGVQSVVNQVKDGIVQASDASDGHFATTYPNVQVFSVPYLFQSREIAWRVLDGPVGERACVMKWPRPPACGRCSGRRTAASVTSRRLTSLSRA